MSSVKRVCKKSSMAVRPPGVRQPDSVLSRPEFSYFDRAPFLPSDYRIPRLPPPPPPPPGLMCPTSGPGLAAYGQSVVPPFVPAQKTLEKGDNVSLFQSSAKRKLDQVKSEEKVNDSTFQETCAKNPRKVWEQFQLKKSQTDDIVKPSAEDGHMIPEVCTAVETNIIVKYESEDLRVPPELLQPLYCKLCGTQLNGTQQANAHYEGKNHRKKEKQYIEKLRNEKVVSTLQQPNANGKAENETKEVKPEDLYCKLCDVAFNSDVQARQHYSGRNHQRRSQGETPLPKGFFNPTTGKWQRQPLPGSNEPKSPPPNIKKKQKFICTVCNSIMTSQLQLDSHLIGAKHRSKVALQERHTESLRGPWTGGSFCTTTGTVDSILATVIATEVEEPPSKKVKTNISRDFSMFRTPSGKYYCSTCNLTLNSESQFAQHFESKKHKARCSSQK